MNFARCEKSLCQYEAKAPECKRIEDCVEKKLCTADKPCECLQSYCTKPYWLREENPELTCQKDQVGGK